MLFHLLLETCLCEDKKWVKYVEGSLDSFADEHVKFYFSGVNIQS
jgi:hypothetical protein